MLLFLSRPYNITGHDKAKSLPQPPMFDDQLTCESLYSIHRRAFILNLIITKSMCKFGCSLGHLLKGKKIYWCYLCNYCVYI